MAPFCFIQYRAAEVSSPPEKAMPTFWPTGSDSRITDMLGTSETVFSEQWSVNSGAQRTVGLAIAKV
jgi:hypothetical protein